MPALSTHRASRGLTPGPRRGILARVQEARGAESFVADPVGRWIATPTQLVWCASPKLAGLSVWGRPSAAEVRSNLAAFDGLRALGGGSVDILMDASGVESVDLEALEVAVGWARARLEELRARIGKRVGVIPPGAHGLVLAGLSPILGWLEDVAIAADRAEALQRLGAPELAPEIDALIAAQRGSAPVVVALRALLREHDGKLDLAAAARALRISVRSLQRMLAAEGRSFRSEEVDARFDAAARLLSTTDEKVATIARRLGISEGTLAQIVRARTGLTPAEYRRRSRS